MPDYYFSSLKEELHIFEIFVTGYVNFHFRCMAKYIRARSNIMTLIRAIIDERILVN